MSPGLCRHTDCVGLLFPVQYRRHAHLRSLRPVFVCLPFGAIVEVNDVDKVKAALKDPEKIVIFQTAPAVRVGLGEAFGMDPGTFVEGKMVAALRTLGADYVFDTDFGADLTIMEEATELLHRLQSEEIPIPQFTSCCPAGRICRNLLPRPAPASVVDQESYQHPQPGHQDLFCPAEEHRPQEDRQCLRHAVHGQESRNPPS